MGMTVTKTIGFDAGHRVARHDSKCANPHGHRYTIALTVEGPVRDDGSAEHGMVIDFARIADWLRTEVHDRYDHGFIVEASDKQMRNVFTLAPLDWKIVVVGWTPTAENLARSIGEQAVQDLAPLTVTAIECHETPTSVARWTP